MNRLLVPLDGSPLAETILPVVEEWAREEPAQVVLLRSVQEPPLLARDCGETAAPDASEVEAYLRVVADRLERRGLPQVRWVVRRDEPAAAIAQAAAGEGAEMIAMATHGRGGLSRLFLGSVADAAVRAARVPVLLIRGQSAWKPWATGKILVPLDGSEQSECILPIVERLGARRERTIILLKVLEPLPATARVEAAIPPEAFLGLQPEEAQRYLDKVAEHLKDRGMRPECAVVFGRAPGMIAAYAGGERVDLIAMATHGRTGLRRLLFGSVAAGVLRSAPVPVLLLKAGEPSP